MSIVTKRIVLREIIQKNRFLLGEEKKL